MGLFVFHIFQAALALTIKGDPTYCVPTVEALRNLISSSQIPVFGICLGHQLLALATGAKTIKLKQTLISGSKKLRLLTLLATETEPTTVRPYLAITVFISFNDRFSSLF